MHTLEEQFADEAAILPLAAHINAEIVLSALVLLLAIKLSHAAAQVTVRRRRTLL